MDSANGRREIGRVWQRARFDDILAYPCTSRSIRYCLTLLFAAAIVGACAGSSQSTSSPACGLAPSDSVFLKDGRVYRECAVEQHAVLVNRAPPDFRPMSPPAQACYSAEIEFVVDATGTPEPDEAQVLRTKDPAFAAAAMASLPRWHYQPAYVHGLPVRQIVKEKFGIAAVTSVVRAGETPRPPTRMPKC